VSQWAVIAAEVCVCVCLKDLNARRIFISGLPLHEATETHTHPNLSVILSISFCLSVCVSFFLSFCLS